MNVHVFLLVFLLIFSLARLGAHGFPHHGPVQSRAAKVRTTLHRLLKPRCPDDCPACRLTSTPSSAVVPTPAPVRPWSEVKGRRGAPKRIDTQGYACPNRACRYFGNTDAQFHALVGDGKHGRAEQIQTFRCQACRTTFTSRRNTPLYRLKTPSHQVAMVLAALAEGLDPSAASRVFSFRPATITTWLTRALEHAQTLHERFFCHLHLPHLQLDELRTRLRSQMQVQWLWLVIDPLTKILPVLELGPRTQNMAHTVIHSLRRSLAPGCLPWPQFVLLCPHSPLWSVAPGGVSRAESVPVASSSGADLRSGEEKLSAAQIGSCHASDAPWNRSGSHSRLTGIRSLWTTQHGVH